MTIRSQARLGGIRRLLAPLLKGRARRVQPGSTPMDGPSSFRCLPAARLARRCSSRCSPA